MTGIILILLIIVVSEIPVLMFCNKIVTLVKKMDENGWYTIDSDGNKVPTKDLLLFNKLTFSKVFDKLLS